MKKSGTPAHFKTSTAFCTKENIDLQFLCIPLAGLAIEMPNFEMTCFRMFSFSTGTVEGVGQQVL